VLNSWNEVPSDFLEVIIHIIVNNYTFDVEDLLSVQKEKQIHLNMTQFGGWHAQFEYYKTIFEKRRENR
jgi:hypothetical protein